MALKIKRFKKGNYDFFLKMDKENMEDSVNRNVKEGWIEKYNKKDFEYYLKKGFIFSLKDENTLIGFLILKIKNKKTLYLRNIQIKKKYQGKGFGLKVLKFVEKFSKKHNCKEIELNVFIDNPAIKIYEKFGFKKIRKKQNNLILMRKNQINIYKPLKLN